MLEGVRGLWRHSLPKHQLGVFEPPQRLGETRAVRACHSRDQPMVEDTANAGPGLRQFFCATESVEAGHQRVL